MNDSPTIIIAIITYKRPFSLARTLRSLQQMTLPAAAVKLLVVDNDMAQSAREIVSAAELPFPVEYVLEDKRGIPHARNKALDVAADSDYLAFIDDDDAVDPTWLCAMLDAVKTFHADVVKGQVIYTFDEDKKHLAVLDIFAPINLPSGSVLDSAWTNNVFFSTRIYRDSSLKFDTGFTQTGGSDHHFFRNAKNLGAAIVFSSEAIVYSPISGNRTGWKWIARRHLRIGAAMTISDLKSKGYYHTIKQLPHAIVDSTCYAFRLMRRVFTDKHPIIHPAMVLCFIIGRVTGLCYISPREYK